MASSLDSTLTFDVVLACLFPLAVLLVGIRIYPSLTWTDFLQLLSLTLTKPSQYGLFSLNRAYNAYLQYSKLSAKELSYMRASYSSIGRGHKRLGHKIGYPAKLERLKQVTDLNATITEGIAELALRDFESDLDTTASVGTGDLGRVRESLKHFVRDWSEDGAEERRRIFEPILEVLKQVDQDERPRQKVLVPGSGLGRLAWEISELGYDTTANELSFFMNLAFRFLLSPESTPSINEHTLRPYAHWFSHQRSNTSLFRSIRFPDVMPRLSSRFHLVENDFLSLPVPSTEESNGNGLFWSTSTSNAHAQNSGGYDFIVTLFFLDTSLNVFATMEQIFALLRPGGIWINLGPLLWTSGGQAKVELSLDEVLVAAEETGFVLETDNVGATARRTVECEYTGDLDAMMRWIYRAEFWVARKPK